MYTYYGVRGEEEEEEIPQIMNCPQRNSLSPAEALDHKLVFIQNHDVPANSNDIATR